MKRRLAVVTAVVASVAVLTGVAVAASSPAVSTGKATSVSQNSAVLNGTVNPNGASTTYVFQWGTTTSYGTTSHTHSAGSGTKSVPVKITAGGLIPGTVYHYRLLATNKFGTSAGADRSFRTAGHPPAGATTGPATNVGRNSATLTGVVFPNGEGTTWMFQWGPTASYGNTTTGGFIGGGNSPVNVSQTLNGLEAGAIFHYRIFATHASGPTTFGSDQIFMTHPLKRPVPGVTRRTRPLHARTQPYTFTTTGAIHPPSSIPRQFACSGLVGLRYFTHGKRAAFRLVPVQPDCTFTVQVTFTHKPGRGPKNRVVTLHLLIHFRGNGYLAPANARLQTLTIG